MATAKRIAWILAFGILLVRPAHAQLHDFRVPSANVVSAMFPPSSRLFPDERYDRWWHEIAACESLRLPPFYFLVQFYQLNAPAFQDVKDTVAIRKNRWAIGESFVLEGQMFIALPYIYDEVVIKHEMLHFLLFWNRVLDRDHPADRFEICGMVREYGH